MSITFNLGANPIWYFADLTGLPLDGGYLASFSSLNFQQQKIIYKLPPSAPWAYTPIPNNTPKLGIQFDANGMQGPFYFALDSSAPDDLYYLEIYDKNGVLQWTINNFIGEGGGGGSTETALSLTNLIVNNVFWRNTGSSASPIGVKQLLIAPGAHSALSNNVNNTNGYYTGPDVYFLKNSTSAEDLITFPAFDLGDDTFSPDVTPTNYFHYECDNSLSGETFKCIQIPITHGVQNLTNEIVTLTFWGKATGDNTTVNINVLQFFGDGPSASPPDNSPVQIATQVLTSGWVKYTIPITIPDASGDPDTNATGECGNDALFIQIGFPLNVPCSIDLTKPSLYLGGIAPTQEYVTYDVVDGVINAPRTGHITQGYDLVAPPGYVLMNDSGIGSASSMASTRANIDTFPLYNLLWNNVSQPSSNAYATVQGGLGASAVDDFVANKIMQLTIMLGRALASAGSGAGLTPRVLGSVAGVESDVLTQANLPIHTAFCNGAFSTETVATGPNTNVPGGVNTWGTGSSSAFSIIQPTSFVNFYIKL